MSIVNWSVYMNVMSRIGKLWSSGLDLSLCELCIYGCIGLLWVLRFVFLGSMFIFLSMILLLYFESIRRYIHIFFNFYILLLTYLVLV